MSKELRIREGQRGDVQLKLVRKARPKIKVVWGDTNAIDKIGVKLTKDSDTHDFQPTDGSGIATLKGDAPGLMPGDYKVALTYDNKLYARKNDPPDVKVAEGSEAELKVELIKLARPKIKVAWKSTNLIEGIGVKLTKSSDTHDLGTTGKDGIAKLKDDAAGLLPGDYKVELTYSDKIFAREKSPKDLKIAEGSEAEAPVSLIKLARPTIKIVDEKGKEVGGIGLKLALKSTRTEKHDFGQTRLSGMTELATDAAGLFPETYVIEPAADRFAPTLKTSADVDLAEGSTATITAKVAATKGALVFDINRYDGAKLPVRVKFKYKKVSGSFTDAETAEVEVDIEKELDTSTAKTVKVKGYKDSLEIKALDPGEYEIEIPKLKDDVLDKQEVSKTWKIGPNKDGKIKVKVELGKTATAAFTLSKYAKAQFIAFNVMAGTKPGYRCATCGSLSATAGDCSSHGARHQYVCEKCGYSADSAGNCTTCMKAARYHCVRCNKIKDDSPGKCPTHNIFLIPKCPTCTKFLPFCKTHTTGTEVLCTQCGKAPKACAHDTFALMCKSGHSLNPQCAIHSSETILYCVRCSASPEKCSHTDFLPICTGGGHWMTRPAAQCPTCPRPLEPGNVYIGLSDPEEDLAARCILMTEAIKAAAGSSKIKGDEVLKVFMAPEFYFRGREGGYDVETLSWITDQMREETKKSTYKDWLFVFGTAIGYFKHGTASAPIKYTLQLSTVVDAGNPAKISVTDGTSGKDKAKATVCSRIPEENSTIDTKRQWKLKQSGTELVVKSVSATTTDGVYELVLVGSGSTLATGACDLLEPVATEIFNAAQIMKGGSGAGVSTLTELIVYKEYVSQLDFIYRAADLEQVAIHETISTVLSTMGSVDKDGASPNKISNPGISELNKSGWGGGVVFAMDGITFGMEVCLDHAQNRLAEFYDTTPPPGTPKVQVHLIPSWGMSIDQGRLAGVDNTLVFNVDGPDGSEAGIADDPSAKSWSPVTTKTSVTLPDNCTATVKLGKSTTQAKPKSPSTKSLTAKLADLFKNKTGSGTSPADFGDIVIYEEQDIPPAETL